MRRRHGGAFRGRRARRRRRRGRIRENSWLCGEGMESDAAARRGGRRLQQGQQFLINVAEGFVVDEEGLSISASRLRMAALAERASRCLMNARMMKTLILTASGLFRTFAAIKAPCSVKAWGRALENLRFPRWSQFATTFAFSPGESWNRKSSGKTFRISFDLLVKAFGGDPVKPGKVGIDEHWNPPERQNRNGQRITHASAVLSRERGVGMLLRRDWQGDGSDGASPSILSPKARRRGHWAELRVEGDC
jgi:hypothetical protein